MIFAVPTLNHVIFELKDLIKKYHCFISFSHDSHNLKVPEFLALLAAS